MLGFGPDKSCSRKADYRHPEAELPLRPEVGTQAQFRKKKAPVTYRYDGSLSPARAISKAVFR
jgi:adenine-specific DNA-methyltransferase